MKIAFYGTHQFERSLYEALNQKYKYDITFFKGCLNHENMSSARGHTVICSYPNDVLDAMVLENLASYGVKLIALRSAGFNHVDLEAAAREGIAVVRVPAYSPYAVAEYAVTLMLALNRKVGRATARVHELNFSLEGLIGFDMHGKTIGIIGTGKIGSVLAKIMTGFGCKVLAYDPIPNQELVAGYQVEYVPLDHLYFKSDIISLHVPLLPATKHLINRQALDKMKKGVMLINTGRGGLIEAKELIRALKSEQVGTAGLDVYEEEENIFSKDLSEGVLQDDVLARLMTFPNVIITAHQAFLTHEALDNIAETTFENLYAFDKKSKLVNQVVR